MSYFQAKRVTKKYVERIAAPPSTIFPLICPVREYDWLDGWSCDLIYSDSGVMEDNCVFTTDYLGNGREIWVTTRYEPDKFEKESILVNPDSRIIRFKVFLQECDANSTDVHWTLTITALNEKGNALVDQYTDEVHLMSMGALGKSLKHFCETGTMLKHNR
jgi:hypothetical protein